MKFSIARDPLLAALVKPLGLAASGHAIPILSHFLIQADTHLAFTATNLETEMTAQVDADIEEGGALTLPARKMADIVRALPAGAMIRLETIGHQAKITSGRSRFQVSTLPADDYPLFSAQEGWRSIACTPDNLLVLFTHVAYAQAKGDVRFYLNGLYLTHDEEHLIAVATNGHRLASYQVPYHGDSESFAIIIPSQAVAEIIRLLKDEASCTLEIAPSALRLTLSASQIITKLIGGRYPDYKRIIPASYQHQARVDRETLRQALLRVRIFSTEKLRGVMLNLDPGKITIKTTNAYQDQAEDVIDAETTASDVRVGFQNEYLLDALQATSEEQVILRLNGSQGPMLIQGLGREEHIQIVMPMLI